MTTDTLRKLYLDFFKAKGHRVFPSDSLVPMDDASLLFTGAGMNQFKPYFLGQKKDVKRAASCQKCLRTADLERVGKTATHHTFFEMLGNFSFGDYFKEEAIAWGWEFVTKELKFPKDRLWVSVFEEDDEAFGLWKLKVGLPESRIVRMGAVDNFWPSNAKIDGPNGPCGPCSEIYVGEVPGKGVEIWNLVFTQFDRQSDGTLLSLPQKNIDTGMGLERTAAMLQGVESNFDIDLFKALRGELKKLLASGADDKSRENAVMDHLRAIVFCVADGVTPSNIGRGYVVRKLLRAASDHLQKAGSREPGSLHRLVPAVVRVMLAAYPELAAAEKNIVQIVKSEENSYLDVIRTYVPQLKRDLAGLKGGDVEAVAFKYRDTYGVPYDNIVECVTQSGLKLDLGRFQEYLDEQKKKSRESTKIAGEIFSNDHSYLLVEGLPDTVFLGYDQVQSQGQLLKIIKEDQTAHFLKKGEEALTLFDQTPFYGESGGQVGDAGEIYGPNLKARVLDSQWIEKCIAHRVKVEEGMMEAGKPYTLKVDSERRDDIMKNHTATHLLHSALRKVLGEHVKQSGSLVAPDRLRFDFTHTGHVGADKLSEVEALVNAEIEKNTRLEKKVLSKDEALREGAIAFFGEKYGDKVRVVTVGGFSKELCGGTHLNSTGEIGLFKILSESSIQAGVRRIEAVTGRGTARFVEDARRELEGYARIFGAEKEALAAQIRALAQKVEKLEARVQNSVLQKMRSAAEGKLTQAPEVNGAKLLIWKEKNANPELFQKTFEELRKLKTSFAALGQCESAGKASVVLGCSADIVSRGFHAGKLVKEISAVLEGSGGGRPELAVGGGKNAAKAPEALLLGEKIMRQNL